MSSLFFAAVIVAFVAQCADVQPVVTGRWRAVLEPNGSTSELPMELQSAGDAVRKCWPCDISCKC